jgi:NADP-dependent 3-hydroxy acid dehydrogenase YdfG
MAADRPLHGRTALITGGSRGIGAECARALAGAGADVILVARDAKALGRIASDLSASKSRVTTHAADLANPDGLPTLLDAIRKVVKDAPDIIVNNAGAFTVASLEETPIDALKSALRLNLASPFLILREFLPAMKKRKSGDVVTLGSVADRKAYPGNTLYAATKFGARGMHEALREETRGSGVRAILISPGPTDTDIWNAVDPDSKPGFTPRAKMLTPKSVAGAVLWAVTQPADVNVDELRLSRS